MYCRYLFHEAHEVFRDYSRGRLGRVFGLRILRGRGWLITGLRMMSSRHHPERPRCVNSGLLLVSFVSSTRGGMYLFFESRLVAPAFNAPPFWMYVGCMVLPPATSAEMEKSSQFEGKAPDSHRRDESAPFPVAQSKFDPGIHKSIPITGDNVQNRVTCICRLYTTDVYSPHMSRSMHAPRQDS